MMLISTICFSSCNEEATLESTNYLPITVVTQTATSITANSVIITATCSAPQDRSSFIYGICIGTSQYPTIETAVVYSGDGKLGSFSGTCDNLQSLTTYYARAYVEDVNHKPVYGNQIYFTTKSTVGYPVLTTTAITSITSTSAVSGGFVSSSGNYSVTARGVCWGEYSNPTITYNTDFTTNSSGTGTFTSVLTNLTEGTTYYVRAYATNSLGTSYGMQVSFTTLAATVTDYDGNIYHTVKIGTQEWMMENLKTKHYNDGSLIPNITDNTGWSALITGAYCDNNNNSSNSTTYGRLYNWYAVNDSRKLAPIGWHVPSDAEWTTLSTYLGGETLAGGKLKDSTTLYWFSPNTGATNETGFKALAGGFRNNDASFGSIGYRGYWWSSDLSSSTGAWARGMYYLSSTLERNNYYKLCGFSVRCIKDN